ncbi:MAG: helix-turn-helix domain-containing protein, partial [Actinomycetota bacterium]|nr:helix-turn-helix domain-containing protein [Actinomycetota bacterium]
MPGPRSNAVGARSSPAIESEPWRGLPATVADVIEPEIPALGDEMLATIAHEVPEYARPLEGSFGRGIRRGVSEALRQFVALVRDPDAGREQSREVYVALGRGELGVGRSLDSLQAAYRVGARVAWRRLGEAGLRANLEPEVLTRLAEAIFAFIDELSADSVEGYSEARSAVEGELQRRRRDLLVLLLHDPPADPADVDAAAIAAGWAKPRAAGALACPEPDLGRLVGRLGTDALVSSFDGIGCVLMSDPEGPGRAAELNRAAGDMPAALGPSGPLSALPFSWRLARLALRARDEGAIDAEGLIDTDQQMAQLLLFEGRALVDRIAARRLRPLADLTPAARQHFEQTALAYLSHQGNAAAAARALHLHPQTVRYRLARLREL